MCGYQLRENSTQDPSLHTSHPLQHPTRTQIPARLNHAPMVKLQSLDDPNYYTTR